LLVAASGGFHGNPFNCFLESESVGRDNAAQSGVADDGLVEILK
jgi:hypothetical protein